MPALGSVAGVRYQASPPVQALRDVMPGIAGTPLLVDGRRVSSPTHLSHIGLVRPMCLRPVQITNGDELLSLLTEDCRRLYDFRVEQERPSVPAGETIRDDLDGDPALVVRAPERPLAGLVRSEVSQRHMYLVYPVEDALGRAISRREQE